MILSMRRALRILSVSLITAGVVILLDAGITLAWQEPLSAAYSKIRQNQAESQLTDLKNDFLDEPASCVAASCINVSPTHHSPTDGCEWQLTSDGNIQLTVECDGENDGTNTSLCTCHIDGDTTKDAGLVQGEGVEACLNAYINCLDPACAQ